MLLSCHYAVHCSTPFITIELPLRRSLLPLLLSRLLRSNNRNAVQRPSPSSIHRRRTFNCRHAVNHQLAFNRHHTLNRRLLSGWLLHHLSSHSCRCLLSTGSGVSARHIQPFSENARHYSLTCWEAACIVLKRTWITNEDEIWIGHVVHSVLLGCLMGAR